MVKKVKGLKVQNKLTNKFKFDNEGQSQIGTDPADTHELKGTMKTSGSLEITGDFVLDRRISETLFGVPQLYGDTNSSELQELVTNIADYEGFIFYLKDAGSTPVIPFLKSEKFYFCENGEWHPSPFTNEEISIVDTDNDTIPDSQDLFLVELVSGKENIFINNPADLVTAAANDLIFELDASNDVMIESNPAQSSGNFELDAQGDVMPKA